MVVFLGVTFFGHLGLQSDVGEAVGPAMRALEQRVSDPVANVRGPLRVRQRVSVVCVS